MKILRALAKWSGILLATPVILFLLLSILLYIPPVQNFVVDTVASEMSRRTGVQMSVREVRLAFPLDLAVHDVLAVERGDTLLDARHLRLHVRLLPLFEGRADVEGADLFGVQLDTKAYIPDLRIRGRVGLLSAVAHNIDWQNEKVRVDNVALRRADLRIELADTAQKDTTTTPVNWVVSVDKADIEDSKVRLSMPGDSMRIAADIGAAALRKGVFDLGKEHYALQSFSLVRSALNYDLPHAPHGVGIDPNHVALTDVNLRVDTLSYAAPGILKAGLQGLALREKSGLALTRLSGGIYMDSLQVHVRDLVMRTPYSRLDGQVACDFNALENGRGGRCMVDLKGAIGKSDILLASKGYADPSLFKTLPREALTIDARMTGNVGFMDLKKLDLQIPTILSLKAQGHVRDVLKDSRSGQAKFSLSTRRLSLLSSLMPASLRQTIALPDRLEAQGKAGFRQAFYEGDVSVRTGGGKLVAKASANTKRETYNLHASASGFPISAFLKGLPLKPFSGTLKASGTGFDPLSPRARLSADARIHSFSYDTYDLSGLQFQALMNRGRATANFNCNNSWMEARGLAEALIHRKGYDMALKVDMPQIDLHKLGVSKDTLYFGTQLDLKATANKNLTAYALNGSVRSNHFTTSKISTMAKDIYLDFATSKDTTTAFVSAGDLRLDMGSKGDIGVLGAKGALFANELGKQLAHYSIDQEKLKSYFPILDFNMEAGQDNPLYNIARLKGYSFSSASLHLRTNPEKGMRGIARVGAIRAGALLLDTVDTYIYQDTAGVQLFGLVKNNDKNPNPLEMRVKSHILQSGAGVELRYLDSEGRTGVLLGVEAAISDEGVRMHLYPENPVIAYRNFKVNRDNYIHLDSARRIKADINLLADDGTGLQIYGEPTDTTNDVTLSLSHVNLAELSSVLPYLPRMSGMLSGDIHVTDDLSFTQMTALGSLEAEGFKYEDTALGTIGVEALYLPKEGGEHHASAFISCNGTEVLACNGTYFDRDGGVFEGDAQLQDFPLQMLNGFLSGTDIGLRGKALGQLDIKGSLDRPEVNGSLDLDSAHIYSEVYGFDFRTDERAVSIKDSRLLFKDYNLYSTGRNPLVLNGTFDMTDFSALKMDFNMRANDFELINTKKKPQSMIFGKVYANYAGTLKGTPDNIAIRGKLDILTKTDVTYVLKDSPLSVEDRLHDLVEFTNFEDTTHVEEARPEPEGSFDLSLGISISDAARFLCSLSDDGQSYVDLEGGGDLTLRMTGQGDMSMTGRFTANSGRMKYQLPVIPLKTFELVQGSYVEFTGDVMNPVLNIEAKERTKAVVTENDQSRSVAFDVGVRLTKPLNEMGLEFLIEAPEDLSVQNQLAVMSAEQRSKAAVTMMATGMYMTDETMMSGTGFKANNALNAFLQSEIQQIAGSALQTIDINLGVESGTSETGTTTTDYSFRFAKRFWGNRISVIVGGKVSTGADATNSAESFINNVSVEYRLDQSATRYVKVFYDRETQDPLEGQLTKTGAGLVLRRKTDRLGELFIFKKKKPASSSTDNP